LRKQQDREILPDFPPRRLLESIFACVAANLHTSPFSLPGATIRGSVLASRSGGGKVTSSTVDDSKTM
jgi:hypothetical protein